MRLFEVTPRVRLNLDTIHYMLRDEQENNWQVHYGKDSFVLVPATRADAFWAAIDPRTPPSEPIPVLTPEELDLRVRSARPVDKRRTR